VEGRRGNYNLNLSAIRQIGLTGVISSFRRDKCVKNADMDGVVQKKISRGTIGVGTHCNENLIYVFLKKELRGLSPNFQILPVGDSYIPRIGPHIFLQ
jgi:hypothetical protein